MQRHVLTKYQDPNLRVYMVWVPKSRGLERDVASATTQYPEPRAMHFWDAPSVLVTGYRETLQLSEDAWDVFMVYGPDARWDDTRPPKPAYWAHQLGTRDKPRVNGPWLDGAVFLERLLAVEAAPLRSLFQPPPPAVNAEIDEVVRRHVLEPGRPHLADELWRHAVNPQADEILGRHVRISERPQLLDVLRGDSMNPQLHEISHLQVLVAKIA